MKSRAYFQNSDDPLMPNYLALLACILHKGLSVSQALRLMEVKTENDCDFAELMKNKW